MHFTATVCYLKAWNMTSKFFNICSKHKFWISTFICEQGTLPNLDMFLVCSGCGFDRILICSGCGFDRIFICSGRGFDMFLVCSGSGLTSLVCSGPNLTGFLFVQGPVWHVYVLFRVRFDRFLVCSWFCFDRFWFVQGVVSTGFWFDQGAVLTGFTAVHTLI